MGKKTQQQQNSNSENSKSMLTHNEILAHYHQVISGPFNTYQNPVLVFQSASCSDFKPSPTEPGEKDKIRTEAAPAQFSALPRSCAACPLRWGWWSHSRWGTPGSGTRTPPGARPSYAAQSARYNLSKGQRGKTATYNKSIFGSFQTKTLRKGSWGKWFL